MSDKRQRPDFDGFDADAFANGVLGRTTGAACGRAAEQLEDLMGDRLAGLDRQLVQAHLEHCTDCRRLAVTVGWLNPLLPDMAEIDPGPEFLAGVLARTTQARRRVAYAEHPTGPAGLMDRVGRWWEKQILRPQFAMQAAYVATVLLVLVFATPGSPLRNVPEQALQAVTAGPQTAPYIGPVINRAGDWLEDGSARAVTAGRSRARNRWQLFDDSLARRTDRTAVSRNEFKAHWQTMIDQAQARELGGAGYEFLEALRTWNLVWDQWWNTSEKTSGP